MTKTISLTLEEVEMLVEALDIGLEETHETTARFHATHKDYDLSEHKRRDDDLEKVVSAFGFLSEKLSGMKADSYDAAAHAAAYPGF